MSEKEKMLNSELYNGYDEELLKLRERSKILTHKINNLLDESEERNNLIRELLGKIGSPFHITSPFYCDYGSNIEIGDNFYSNFGCIILDCNKVTIGDNVLFGPNVSLFAAYHPLDYKLRRKDLELSSPIKIGNDVWVGGNVTILPGVSIGDNVVIGAGSVVTRDIPSNSVAYGNPCRIKKKLD